MIVYQILLFCQELVLPPPVHPALAKKIVSPFGEQHSRRETIHEDLMREM